MITSHAFLDFVATAFVIKDDLEITQIDCKK